MIIDLVGILITSVISGFIVKWLGGDIVKGLIAGLATELIATFVPIYYIPIPFVFIIIPIVSLILLIRYIAGLEFARALPAGMLTFFISYIISIGLSYLPFAIPVINI